MNYKNLNYEIETECLKHCKKQGNTSMNYKNLNYEIETLSKLKSRRRGSVL